MHLTGSQKLLRIIKVFLIAFILLLSYSLYAFAPYSVTRIQNGYNVTYIAVINRTNYDAYCTIKGANYFVDFYVRAHSQGRWYAEPYGYYEWYCS